MRSVEGGGGCRAAPLQAQCRGGRGRLAPRVLRAEAAGCGMLGRAPPTRTVRGAAVPGRCHLRRAPRRAPVPLPQSREQLGAALQGPSGRAEGASCRPLPQRLPLPRSAAWQGTALRSARNSSVFCKEQLCVLQGTALRSAKFSRLSRFCRLCENTLWKVE